MRYICMGFGWYQELLREAQVEGLASAEEKLLEMLDRGAMIVHVYRETDAEHPELVGRHSRLRSFFSGVTENTDGTTQPHEVERFLLDSSAMDDWAAARRTDRLLDQRWSVIELWADSRPAQERDEAIVYGRAMLIAQGPPRAV